MVSGVPLLCVPLHADNGYISGLVHRLRVGKRVWKQDVGKPRFKAALDELLA